MATTMEEDPHGPTTTTIADNETTNTSDHLSWTQRTLRLWDASGMAPMYGDDDQAVVRLMEQWLDMDSTHTYYEGLTLQDCCPLPPAVYDDLYVLLVEAWTDQTVRPDDEDENDDEAAEQEGTGRLNPHKNAKTTTTTATVLGNHPFEAAQARLSQQSNSNNDAGPSLADVWPSVRWTHLLWQWTLVDSNVTRHLLLTMEEEAILDSHDNDGNDNELQQQLQRRRRQRVRAHRLVRALYQHVSDLPRMQAQLHHYTQSLRTTSSSSSSSVVGSRVMSGAERAAAYQRWVERSSQLDHAWQQHTARLRDLLGQWYRHSPAPLRAYMRPLLGHVLQTFIQATSGTPSSSSSLRTENTQAANVALALHVLHAILRGHQQPQQQPSDGNTQQQPSDGNTTTADSTTSSSTVPTTTTTSCTTTTTFATLLERYLWPLHVPNTLVLWRDQTPVLSLYHEPLTQCVALIVQAYPNLLVPTLQYLLQPSCLEGPTAKQILLLHEVDSLLGLKDVSHTPGQSSWFLRTVLPAVTKCMTSDHSGVAERALEFIQNEHFCQLLLWSPSPSTTTATPQESSHHGAAYRILLRALVARQQPSWNPTVRKRTYLVLQKLQRLAPDTFVRVSNQLYDEPTEQAPTTAPTFSQAPTSSSSGRGVPPTARGGGALPRARPPSFSRPSTGSGVRPPAAAPSAGGRMQPPRAGGRPASSVRGQSSMPPPYSSSVSAAMGLRGKRFSAQQPPPLTITGVAPWAMGSRKPLGRGAAPLGPANLPSQQRPKRPAPGLPTIGGISEDDDDEEEPDDDDDNDDNEKTSAKKNGATMSENNNDDNAMAVGKRRRGEEIVLAYMEKIKPPDLDTVSGASSWSVAQMAETPTLLPTLKFHDLVFGHELGRGSFGTVKYARLIDRTRSRSGWAEYAVKIVATDLIRKLGYDASIQREIAALRLVSHPGVARLISAFRFREGAYLVLEYASHGDLHGLLQKQGSLDEASTRFVVGELVATLASINELGLVYGDLKPENIVVTEGGHLKLTDFGGCRPVTAAARDTIRQTARNILRDLRDGDWQQQPPQSASPTTATSSEATTEEKAEADEKMSEDVLEDIRVEGTTAYLPPEVVMGAAPTILADSWALGCVMYQCLSGRPPLLQLDDEATRQRIVTFALPGEDGSTSERERLFVEKHARGISTTAQDLILSLLDRDVTTRPGMRIVAEHAFFEGQNVFGYHAQEAYPLKVGAVDAPPADAKWARRQFSSIWSPQPAKYQLSMDDSTNSSLNSSGASGPFSQSAIVEGAERNASFVKYGTNKNNNSRNEGGDVMLPPRQETSKRSSTLVQIAETDVLS